MDQTNLREKLQYVIDHCDEEEGIDYDISDSRSREIFVLLKDSSIVKSLDIFNNSLKFKLDDLIDLSDDLTQLSNRISEIKEDIEVEKLFKNGQLFNWKKIKRIFEKRNVFKDFSKFNWDKFQDMVKNPPLEIDNGQGGIVKIDTFLARKFIIAIIQMIGNKMDLWIANTGGEGSGKSNLGSQQIRFLFTFLHGVGLINYDLDIKEIIKGSLKDLLNYLGDQEDKDYFRISELDEAEDLDRLNYREDDNKLFKSTMRRCRKNLNIIILNTPQIGEIDTSVTLARINFIFSCKMKYDATTGMLNKGYAKMFIIPRTEYTFSPYFRRNLSRFNIKSVFSKQFEKKIDYYKDIPDEILIKDIRFYEHWGFDEDEYDKHIRVENKKKHFEGGVSLTKDQMYILYRYAPALKNWYDKLEKKNITVHSKDYEILRKFLKRISNVFVRDDELLKRMENTRRYK